MANEVSFFHSVRKMKLEEKIERLERTIKLVERSRFEWADEGPEEEYENNKILTEMIVDLRETKEALEECKKDLAEAIAERR